jgi:serine/threonine protein phosphatase PrpC
MWQPHEPGYDVASAISQGGRDYQEDTIVTDFPLGSDSGFVVLADGMGGHAAGDVASKIVVTEVFSELKFQSESFGHSENDIPTHLFDAAKSANECLLSEVSANPETMGMGSTLVSVVIRENRLFWISIGDSPLYILRNGKLEQLNEDHSMAPQIDFMVESGMIDAEVGKNHPDRNCLTSVLMGEAVAKIDCPKTPYELKIGDVILVSSDGLQYLENKEIQEIMATHAKRPSSEISAHLLEAIRKLDDPDQDNVSFSVIKVNDFDITKPMIVSKPANQGHEKSHVGTTVANLNKDLIEPITDRAADVDLWYQRKR